MLVVRDPDDASVVGEIACASAAQVETALARGAVAFTARRLPAYRRAEILAEVSRDVSLRKTEFAQLIASEGIKTIREASREVERCVETLRLASEEARRIGGDVVGFDQVRGAEGRTGWYTLRPAGLVIAITPYNDPLNLVAHKLAAAFALGAPVIVKPHPQTPFSADRLVRSFHAAGAPEPMVQIVQGRVDTAVTLVRDPRPRVISFTGGRQGGAAIAATAGLKRLLLELGGVGVVAVAADADLDRAASAITSGAFWAAGQNCVHAQRIIVHAELVAGLIERLVDQARSVRLGPKRDEATDMGPMVDEAAARRIIDVTAAIRAAGGRILTGATASGARVQPTWADGLPDDHPLLGTEIFGPVSTIETAESDDDVLARLGRAGDAVNAAIFTGRIGLALDAYERANAAALIVNDSTDFRIDAMPFGGVGAAGLGREGIADAIDAMSEKKLMVLRRD